MHMTQSTKCAAERIAEVNALSPDFTLHGTRLLANERYTAQGVWRERGWGENVAAGRAVP